MKTYLAYIRVSTQRQSDRGTFLFEQRRRIERYAEARALAISAWCEEVETASTKGRPIFRKMVQEQRHERADGLILHKIDRGARNLRDWADLDGATVLGGLIVSTIGLAALSRAEMPEQARRPLFLYVDEFQTFTTLSFVNMWPSCASMAWG